MSKKPEIRWATKPLALPIDLIVTEYRQAKDPKKIIDILADQCSTKPCRIAWILNRCGMAVPADKMPRPLRSENSFDYVAHWEASEDAAICDRLAEQMRAAQSMPGFDEPDMTVPEVIKPFVVEAMEQVKTGCTVEKETEREVRTVAAERMFETDSQFIKRVTEEYGVPDDPLANAIEEPDGIARRREILADAAVCVCTDRNMLYGEPEDSFGMIARLWEGYLGIPVTENDVVDLMILMKVARNGTAKVRCRDTYVDIAGYAACGGGGIEV